MFGCATCLIWIFVMSAMFCGVMTAITFLNQYSLVIGVLSVPRSLFHTYLFLVLCSGSVSSHLHHTLSGSIKLWFSFSKSILVIVNPSLR